MPEAIFIGRDKYIDKFQELLSDSADEPKPYILNLRGGGGIGKTKILQEFVLICEQKNIAHTGIIDFYDSVLNSQIRFVEYTIARNLSDTLETGPFKNYWKERLRAQELHAKSDPGYNIARETSKKQFFADLKAWADYNANLGKRGVVIFDTFEAVKNKPVGARVVNDWLPLLRSAIVVISGRQKMDEIDFPPEIAGLVEDEPVGEFTSQEAVEYLRARDVWTLVEQDKVVDELFDLTDRQPLRLALSADRLDTYNFLTPLSPKQLVAGANKATFEKKLVEEMVLDMQRPEVLVLPAMAHVPRPYDLELIDFLFPNADAPEAILSNLSELSFIKEIIEDSKPRYWFQDELRSMFHKYIFEAEEFKWKQIRQDTSQKMLDFYDAKKKEAEQAGDHEALNQAIADKYYHEIYLDSKKFDEAQRKFQKARDVYEGRLASMILASVSSAVAFLDADQRFSLRLMEARLLRDNDYVKQSRQELQRLLEEHGTEPDKAVHIHNALGGTLESLGDLNGARDSYSSALRLSKKLQLNYRLPREELNIGRVYRRIGNREEAVKHLEQSYELALHQESWEEVARSLYELGYAYMSFGEHAAGLEYSGEAINTWQGLQNPLSEAKSRVLRGAILREMDELDDSLLEINEAIEIYTRNKFFKLGEAYFHLGVVEWVQALRHSNEQLLERARTSLESSISKSREDNNQEFLALALDRISNVYWAQEDKQKARQAVGEAYQVAMNNHYSDIAVNSLLGMAEFDYIEEKYDSLSNYSEMLKNEFEDQGYNFPLFYGRMRRILGDVSLKRQAYKAASNYYAEGLFLISQHGGYGVRSIDKELSDLETKLLTLPPETARKICEVLKSFWTEKALERNKPKMISWVIRLINHLAFRNHTKQVS